MKKIISMLVITIITVSAMFAIAFASTETTNIVLDPIQFSAANNSLTVSGVINYNRDRIPMTIHVSQRGKVIAVEETLAVKATDGEVAFSFPPIDLNVATLSGDLNIYVTASFVDWNVTTTYYYNGVDIQFAAMTNFQRAIVEKNKTALAEHVRTYAEHLSIDAVAFDSLSDTAETILLNSLITRQYTLPDNYDTKEECAKVQAAVGQFLSDYQEAMALGSFFDIDTTSELKAWYDANKDVYKLLDDDIETEPDESKMVYYFEAVMQTKDYLDRKVYMNSATNMKELNLLIKHQAILQTVKDLNQYNIRNILADFPKLLTSLNFSRWHDLSNTRQSDVCLEVVGKSYSTIALFCDAVNNAIENAATGSGSSSSSGGSSGGGGGRVFDGTGSSIVPTQVVLPFTDIEHVTWAKDSILYLYKNKIVSGKDAVTFAPDDQVTRAELVKMLVCGLGLTGQSGAGKSFNDVSPNAWYAQYVSIAADHGIVNGDENGNFNPEAPISRQDAATIMYRAFKSTKKVGTAYFEDYSSISDYAKAAVDYMYAKGVINGIGDGMFAPFDKLSRAQAAKMLHLMLVLKA